MADNVKPDELPAALDKIFSEFIHSSFEARQKGLQAGAEVFRDAVAAVTPTDTGDMSKMWQIKTKYKDRRYVGNARIAKGVVHRKTKDGSKGEAREGVPLSNVLECSDKSPHKGFIRRCFEDTEPQIFAAIKSKLNNGGK